MIIFGMTLTLSKMILIISKVLDKLINYNSLSELTTYFYFNSVLLKLTLYKSLYF